MAAGGLTGLLFKSTGALSEPLCRTACALPGELTTFFFSCFRRLSGGTACHSRSHVHVRPRRRMELCQAERLVRQHVDPIFTLISPPLVSFARLPISPVLVVIPPHQRYDKIVYQITLRSRDGAERVGPTHSQSTRISCLSPVRPSVNGLSLQTGIFPALSPFPHQQKSPDKTQSFLILFFISFSLFEARV